MCKALTPSCSVSSLNGFLSKSFVNGIDFMSFFCFCTVLQQMSCRRDSNIECVWVWKLKSNTSAHHKTDIGTTQPDILHLAPIESHQWTWYKQGNKSIMREPTQAAGKTCKLHKRHWPNQELNPGTIIGATPATPCCPQQVEKGIFDLVFDNMRGRKSHPNKTKPKMTDN